MLTPMMPPRAITLLLRALPPMLADMLRALMMLYFPQCA